MLAPLKRLVARMDGHAPGRLGLVVALCVILSDQISKLWVLHGLNLSPDGCLDWFLRSPDALYNTCEAIEISGVFDLTMVWNIGVSFGLLGADNALGRWLLVIFSVVVAAGLAFGLAGRGPIKALRPLQGLAFGFIIGGALGNAIDRAVYGAVVDFLDFSGLMFPYVFNIADVAINLGVAALLMDILLGDDKNENSV